MKQINKYEALDGKVFNTIKECLKYDVLIKLVDEIMKDFPKLPKDDNCSFINGGGYLQHKKEYVEKAKKEITELGNKLFGAKGEDKISFGWVGRYFDDSGKSCLYSAWGRLSHIDDQYREWGQGYYAVNPDKGIQKRLN